MKNKLSFLIFGLAVLFYGNTLFNKYAYDDADLILSNSQVKRGIPAIGDIFRSKLRDGSGATKNELYRPITKLVYALEWSIS